MEKDMSATTQDEIYSEFDFKVVNRNEFFFCLLAPCRQANKSFVSRCNWVTHRARIHKINEDRKNIPDLRAIRKWHDAGKPRSHAIPAMPNRARPPILQPKYSPVKLQQRQQQHDASATSPARLAPAAPVTSPAVPGLELLRQMQAGSRVPAGLAPTMSPADRGANVPRQELLVSHILQNAMQQVDLVASSLAFLRIKDQPSDEESIRTACVRCSVKSLSDPAAATVSISPLSPMGKLYTEVVPEGQARNVNLDKGKLTTTGNAATVPAAAAGSRMSRGRKILLDAV